MIRRILRNAVALATGLVIGAYGAEAFAAQYHVPNQGGGAMVVTGEPCVVGGEAIPNLKRAFSFVKSGEQIEGCWGRVSEDVIRIFWITPDGEVHAMEYPIGAFKKVTGI